MSYPWPEQWLEECRAAYQMDSPEAVQESIWVQELMSEAKKRLPSIRKGIQENRKTAEVDIDRIYMMRRWLLTSRWWKNCWKQNRLMNWCARWPE